MECTLLYQSFLYFLYNYLKIYFNLVVYYKKKKQGLQFTFIIYKDNNNIH